MANDTEEPGRAPRRRRADAQRNVSALLEAAKAVFDTTGVDAPVKEIAQRAGVGVGTLYRHFPRRADLVVAVVQSRIDALADSGPRLAATLPPDAALLEWLHGYTELLATKRGLATALHSGDPAFEGLRPYFSERLEPTVSALLDAAAASGAIRGDIEAADLLWAIANLCLPRPGEPVGRTGLMVAVFIDGLRAR
jgi:AcrR family transcriptional regulator